jgi:hypothetical protein
MRRKSRLRQTLIPRRTLPPPQHGAHPRKHKIRQPARTRMASTCRSPRRWCSAPPDLLQPQLRTPKIHLPIRRHSSQGRPLPLRHRTRRLKTCLRRQPQRRQTKSPSARSSEGSLPPYFTDDHRFGETNLSAEADRRSLVVSPFSEECSTTLVDSYLLL